MIRSAAFRAAALFAMAIGLSGCRTVEVRPATKFPYQDDLSFRGFAEEALYGFGMPRTSLFDDYTPGSYHVEPREVVDRLPEFAALYGLELEAVVVLGPFGPIWEYDVITVVRDAECARVNWLDMPHARITLKRSGCLAAEEVTTFLDELGRLATHPEATFNEDPCLVIRRGGVVRWSAFECHSEGSAGDIEQMDESLRRLSSRLQITYSHGPPVEP